MNHLLELRKKLHAHPELSNLEVVTQSILVDFLGQYGPSRTLSLAQGKALLIEFDSGEPGPHLLYRADMDALPIHEESLSSYRSKHPGVSHKCGHDGHMTLACALPAIWQNTEGITGKLGLLFQHAEEVAGGAKEIIEDSAFRSWSPTVVFGLHNLPGFETNEVVLSEDVFSCSSVGLGLSFSGHSAHAAEPSKAHTPFPALIALCEFTQSLNSPAEDDEYFLATMVHLRLGEENFGITPGEGRICFTLRAKHTHVLLRHKEALLHKARILAGGASLELEVEEFDFFPATRNDRSTVDLLELAARSAQLQVRRIDFPFRWSEDFGFYEKVCKSAFFGIGNGKNSFPLHHPEYDFNDELIQTFQALWTQLMRLDSFSSVNNHPVEQSF